MPFDIPFQPIGQNGGGFFGSPLGSTLLGLGVGAAQSFITSRFQDPGDDGMGELPATIPSAGTMAVTTVGRDPCANPCRIPDFVTTPDACHTRPTQRTMLVNGCKVVVPGFGQPRRRPRMNPLNIRAANRASRRLNSMGRAVKRARKGVNAAARSLK